MDPLSVILTSSVPSAKSEIKKNIITFNNLKSLHIKNILLLLYIKKKIYIPGINIKKKPYYYLHQYVARFTYAGCMQPHNWLFIIMIEK